MSESNRLGSGVLVATAIGALAMAGLVVPACGPDRHLDARDAGFRVDVAPLVFSAESSSEGMFVVATPPAPVVNVCPRGHRVEGRVIVYVKNANGTTDEFHVCWKCLGQFMGRNFPAEGRRKQRR